MAPAAVISRRLWRTLFDSDPSAIGRQIIVNGQAFSVAGIAPAAFQGRSLMTRTDLWLPMGAHMQLTPGAAADQLTNRRLAMFGDAFGRLKPGATIEVAQQQATAAAHSTDFGGRATRRNSIGPVLYAGITHDVYTTDRLLTMFKLVMGAVALVLLLACANAANLMLARAVGRRREIAVCQAIGASRLRIVRQQLAEGLVLSAAAGVLGLGLAIWLTALFDGMRIATYLPAVKNVSIDVRVILFTMTASLATGLLFAIAPALASSRVDLTASLKDSRTSTRGGRGALRGTLTVVQVAVSVLLLVAAGLLVRTLDNIRSLDLGLDPARVVSFSANPARQGYKGPRAQQYFEETMARLRAVPGVEAVAFSWSTPFIPNRSETGFTAVGGDGKAHRSASNTISPGFFGTMRIPLVAGREFTDAEWRRDSSQGGVVILSDRLAREVFPAGGALGSRLLLDYPKGKEVEVVGVVGDVRGRPLTKEPEGYAYFPASDTTWGMVHVRSALPFTEVETAIRDTARSLNPLLPPYDVEPFAASLDRVLAEQRLLARASVTLGAVAALLAAIGVYGMMACAVGERMREFGIRLALGARTRGLLGLVLRSALGVTAIGIAAGLGASSWTARALESRLFGVAAMDPVTLGGACAALAMLAIVATLIPAWRATRADPVASLRAE